MGSYLAGLFEIAGGQSQVEARSDGGVVTPDVPAQFEVTAFDNARTGTENQAGVEANRDAALFNNLLCWSFMGVVTLLACGLVDRFGRRPLWLLSSVVMIGANAFIGMVFHWRISGWPVLVAIFVCAIPHSLALGPLPWLMMSEIFPTRIPARAVAITTTFIWFVGFMASALFPVLAKLSTRPSARLPGCFGSPPRSACWRSSSA